MERENVGWRRERYLPAIQFHWRFTTRRYALPLGAKSQFFSLSLFFITSFLEIISKLSTTLTAWQSGRFSLFAVVLNVFFSVVLVVVASFFFIDRNYQRFLFCRKKLIYNIKITLTISSNSSVELIYFF